MDILTKDQIDELDDAYFEASDAYHTIANERSSFIGDLVRKAKEQAEALAHIEFGERISVANDLRRARRRSVEDARIARAVSGADARYPLGTVLVEWTGKWGEKTTTGRRVVYEVFVRGSVYQDNMASYNAPKLGDFVYRLLKKDGKPSRQLVGIGGFSLWLPEGKDPNVPKEE